jgi:hypothetical protein
MRYTVDWSSAAIAALAGAYLQARDPSAVTTAQDTIDRQLARDPTGNGTHLSEGLWWIDVPPLLAYYWIDQKTRTVKVVQLALAP